LDKLIEAWEPGESWELVLAGGINPNHRNNRDTVKYVRKLYLGAKKKNINITGFVPEHEIPLYYSAADVILIPYPAMMSSSGPLALAWGYDKAVQLSAELRGYLVSDDFRQAMRDSGISEEELFFEMNQSGIETMRNHLTKSRLETLKSLALKMQEIRHLKNIGREMAEVLGEIN
jgi:glycosyltransferase involved in cell wall biosynthesis